MDIGNAAAIASILGCILALVEFLRTRSTVSGILLGLTIIAVIVLWFGLHRWRNLAEIVAGVKKLTEQLYKAQLGKIDMIVAVNRNGAIAAGMLAPALGIPRVMVFDRISTTGNAEGAKQTFRIAPDLSPLPEAWKSLRIVIVCLVEDTADTLEEGARFLVEQGVQPDAITKASVFIEPGAVQRSPKIIHAVCEANARARLDRLPWMSGNYPYLP